MARQAPAAAPQPLGPQEQCNTADLDDASSSAATSSGGASPALAGRAAQDEAAAGGKEERRRVGLADSWFFLEGAWAADLPVAGARLYNLAVRPVALPSGALKLVALPVFWLVCLGWHALQRRAQLAWEIPGEPGQTVAFERTLPGGLQVLVNVLCVVGLSTYAMCAYLFHHTIMDRVLNPLFTPRSWIGHVAMAAVMYGIALASSFFLRQNWVAAAAGLFMFFAYAVCGRTVQESASQRGQIGLGPSRAEEDAGASFHARGICLESGSSSVARASLVGGEAGEGPKGGALRFARLRAEPFTIGDDAVLVEQLPAGGWAYRGPCGRAIIFRTDCLIVLLLSFGLRLPEFVIGGGGFNQCAGLVELVCSLVYIPVGYTCFAVFGFRVGLACRWSMMVVLALCFWPFINLVLGGKGCGTLTELVGRVYLPQIWDSQARHLTFSRGYASCSEAAYQLGGETLLVASTTIAAWVHIMSNFSFLFGFISGMARMPCGREVGTKIEIS